MRDVYFTDVMDDFERADAKHKAEVKALVEAARACLGQSLEVQCEKLPSGALQQVNVPLDTALRAALEPFNRED